MIIGAALNLVVFGMHISFAGTYSRYTNTRVIAAFFFMVTTGAATVTMCLAQAVKQGAIIVSTGSKIVPDHINRGLKIPVAKLEPEKRLEKKIAESIL